MSKIKKDPKAEMINEIIQLTRVRDEYWSYHPQNPHSVDVTIEIPKIDKAIEEIQSKIEKLDK
jgi:hypothetical protein|tara:strand:+ start:223 stop:411 length:189 start_codon:yes stop_codon:yes gene_type:complete